MISFKQHVSILDEIIYSAFKLAHFSLLFHPPYLGLIFYITGLIALIVYSITIVPSFT